MRPLSVERDSLVFSTGSHLSFDLSPDGRRIAFDLLGQLWLLPSEGGTATALTDAVRDSADSRQPLYSPDGRSLLYRSDIGDSASLWNLLVGESMGEGRVHSLARLGGASAPREWDRDGQGVLMVERVVGQPVWEIRRRSIATDSTTTIPVEGLPYPSIREAVPSLDGTRIAIVNTSHFLNRFGRIWEVAAAGGMAVPITPPSVLAAAPSYSPNGTSVAYFGPDSSGTVQVWIASGGSPPRAVTRHGIPIEIVNCQYDGRNAGVPLCDGPLRVRWTPDGQRLIYAWDGRLWSVAVADGDRRAIPFTAHLALRPAVRSLPPVRFAEPGGWIEARGHTGLGVSPDGMHVALLAGDSLWVVNMAGSPRALTYTGWNATGVSWSPDGRHLLWSAGRAGSEDVFVSDLESGRTRRLTQMAGVELQATWSPDGRHIAFVHTDTVVGASARLLVVSAEASIVQSVGDTRDLGPALAIWRSSSSSQDRRLQWSPDGTQLLIHPAPVNGVSSATIVPLNGERRRVSVPRTVTGLRWTRPGELVYIDANQLFSVSFDANAGAGRDARMLEADGVMFVAAGGDGSLAYTAPDGLRVRRPDGTVVRLGWPVRLRVPMEPELVLRNVRLIDGTGAAATPPRDILVQAGRITRIVAAGSGIGRPDADVVDAAGRFVIPGLIDAHQHLAGGDAMLPALLYNGVTTIRVPDGRLGWIAAMRDAVSAGVRAGPHVVFGMRYGPGCARQDCERSETLQLTTGSEDSQRSLRLAAAYGASWVKMYVPFTSRAGARLIAQAHDQGMRVTGHYAHMLPLLAAGMDGKEHALQDGDRTSPIIQHDLLALTRWSGMWVTPTNAFVAMIGAGLDNPRWLDDPATRALYSDPTREFGLDLAEGNRKWTAAAARDWRQRSLLLYRAGIPLMVGTDGRMPWLVHLELEELVRAGLTPLEAIHAGTRMTAQGLGLDSEIGTLAIGKRADLLILDGDPTVDIAQTRRIWRVMQNGRIIDRESLVARIRAGR